jgi:pimeloyl-ACP methyl ester carboxylesterase
VQELYSIKTKGPFEATTVFLHGNLASHVWWQPLLSLQKNKKANHLLIDWRGCGESPYWKEGTKISIEELCADLSKTIDSQLDANEEFVLVGHSLGGLLSAILAAKYQNRVKSLYLLDPVGPTGVQFDESMYTAIAAMGKDKALTQTVILSTIYNENLELDLKQKVIEHAFKAVKNIGLEILDSLKNIDIREDLKSITAKTRVVWGEHDLVISKDDCKLYMEFIENCEFAEIKGQGHSWNVENPESFLNDVKQFLL